MTKSRTNADNVTADIAGITAGTGITGGGTSGTVTITNDMATTIAAAGDLIYGTANDAYAALSLGTAGKVLKVNSGATAPEWAVDPTTDVVTTAGDLIYGTGADAVARLGIGTSGQYLKVNSGATAPEWGTLATGSMTLLSTTTLSGATTTVSGISGSYLHLYIAIDRLSVDGAANEFYLQPNSSSSLVVLYVANATWSNSQGAFLFTNTGAGQNYTVNSTGAFIMNYAATNMYKPMFAFGANTNPSALTRGFMNGGMYHETTAVTSVMVRPSANNFNGGTMRIYGVN